MNNSPCSQTQEQLPSLSIDQKKNRIRIHKKTLYMLDNPTFIQILVNPDKKALVIMPSVKEDHLAHRINWMYLDDSSKSYELYSKTLVEMINSLQIWEPRQIYKVEGELVKTDIQKACIRFNLCEAVILSEA